jgi:hypothetical protein
MHYQHSLNFFQVEPAFDCFSVLEMIFLATISYKPLEVVLVQQTHPLSPEVRQLMDLQPLSSVDP